VTATAPTKGRKRKRKRVKAARKQVRRASGKRAKRASEPRAVAAVAAAIQINNASAYTICRLNLGNIKQ
jgi:hypothetical protein